MPLLKKFLFALWLGSVSPALLTHDGISFKPRNDSHEVIFPESSEEEKEYSPNPIKDIACSDQTAHISVISLCDGIPDCQDLSDENPTLCHVNGSNASFAETVAFIPFGNDGKFIPVNVEACVCYANEVQCPGDWKKMERMYSDELECKICETNQGRIKRGECITDKDWSNLTGVNGNHLAILELNGVWVAGGADQKKTLRRYRMSKLPGMMF